MAKVLLRDVCKKITDGSHNPPSGIDQSEYLMISSKNVDDDNITFDSPRYLTKYDFEIENKRTCITPGDLLMTIVGTVGRTAVVPMGVKNICVQRSVGVLKPNTDIIIPRYLMYQLQSMRDSLEKEAHGVAQKGIYLKQVEELSIVIPELSKQCDIVTILDRVSTLIAARKKQLQKLDDLVKARFVEMFGDPILNPMGWEQVTLKDVSIGKLQYGSGASATEYDGKVRYVRITDITDAGDLNDDRKSPDCFDEKYLLHHGNILFARSGATVGKTFCYDENKHEKAIFAGYLIRMIPDETKVLPVYVFYFTKTEYYGGFVANVQKAVAQPNINAQEYGDLTICIPSMKLQQDCATFVSQTDKSKLSIQQSLEKLETLKQSLMQQYFG